MTCVVNINLGEVYDVYCGRGSPYGNEWSHRHGTQAKHIVPTLGEAIWQYEQDLLKKPELVAQMKGECTGKRLGCFCRPAKGFRGKLMCHCQIIAGLCDGVRPEEVA